MQRIRNLKLPWYPGKKIKPTYITREQVSRCFTRSCYILHMESEEYIDLTETENGGTLEEKDEQVEIVDAAIKDEQVEIVDAAIKDEQVEIVDAAMGGIVEDLGDLAEEGQAQDEVVTILPEAASVEVMTVDVAMNIGSIAHVRDNGSAIGVNNITEVIEETGSEVKELLEGKAAMEENISCDWKISKSATAVTESQPLKEDGDFTGEDNDAAGGDVRESPQNRRSSLKRSRPSHLDDSPSILITYRNLTSESKKKLKEFLRQWAEWQSKNSGSTAESKRGNLECGEEEYFPALQVGEENNLTVHFWMDKPSKQPRVDHSSHEIELSGSQEEENDVPLYDRACTATLISEEITASLEGCLELPEEDSRCFNCGSYSHSLRDCPRPRDNAAINNARKMHSQKRGASAGPRVTSRYYQSSPGGKFDDLKPGVLGSETRQSLGIGNLDPPPWLNRMRELGYPPGYLDEPDEPSGITIFGVNEDTADGIYLGEDGEITGDVESTRNGVASEKLTPASRMMMVDFPGVNAPIPENADERRWAAPRAQSGYAQSHITVNSIEKTTDRKPLFSSRYSATAVTADGVEHAGCGDRNSFSDVSPVTGRESFGRSPRVRSSPVEIPGGSAHRYSSEKSNSTGRPGKVNEKIAYPGTSHLGSRSTPDPSRRSPQISYDEHHALPPLSGQGLVGRQSGLMHSPQAYLSPQSARMHSPQAYHSPHSGPQHTHSPGWRTLYSRDSRDDMTEARRQAWAQAYEALASSRQNEPFERSASRRR